MTTPIDLLQGIVVQTSTKTLLGPAFYSDRICGANAHYQTLLNELAKESLIGIAAGITRMALSVIHSIGHLFAALLTFNKGHLYHAAKGACEFLRGLIESLPFIGRAFANHYYDYGYWWIIKIYNPNTPDTLDIHNNHWRHFMEGRPTGYIIA